MNKKEIEDATISEDNKYFWCKWTQKWEERYHGFLEKSKKKCIDIPFILIYF